MGVRAGFFPVGARGKAVAEGITTSATGPLESEAPTWARALESSDGIGRRGSQAKASRGPDLGGIGKSDQLFGIVSPPSGVDRYRNDK